MLTNEERRRLQKYHGLIAGSGGRVDVLTREEQRDMKELLNKAGGFSIVTDDCSNIQLLKHTKPIAWFSRTVSRETVKVFVELVKYFERKHKGPKAD